MSSSALVGPSSGSNFAQQGAVDWVALSKSTFSFSVEVLSRFSKAGVELITVAIGQAIFSGFDIPADGQKRLHDAVSKLNAFASYGDILWFGLPESYARRNRERRVFASQVLKASTDLTKTPGSLTPALSQWGALMAVCAGAVTASQFPSLVEGLSRLVGGRSQGCDQQPLHTPTTAKALAGAIQELSKVSNGTLRDVTFQGGVDCGWLAAVAQWLLCLRVEILDSNGTCLYSNFLRSDHHAQVIVIQQLEMMGDLEGTMVSGRSYFVPPGCLRFGLADHNATKEAESIHLYSHGRAQWDNIIKKTFGGAADELLHPKNVETLAMFLCSGFDESKPKSGMDRSNPWGDFFLHNCYERRRAFMMFASVRLPELALAATFAENHQFDPQRPFNYYLKSICPCKECSPGSTWKGSSFCLHRIGAIIFRYLWILSWLDIEPEVKPSSTGLLLMYHTRTYGDEDHELLKSQFWQIGLDTSLFPLFTGTICAEKTTGGVSAMAHNGVCIYYASLENPNVSPPRSLRQRVVLGNIENNGALYQKIRDKHGVRNEAKEYSELPLSVLKLGPKTQLLLVANDTLDSRTLEVSFYIESTPIPIPSKGIISHVHDSSESSGDVGVLSKEMFGICELRNKIMRGMNMGTCNRCKVQIRPQHGEQSDCWTGSCLEAPQVVFKDLNVDLVASFPKQGEWVLHCLSLCKNVQEHEQPRCCCFTILRGEFNFLYSVLCYSGGGPGNIEKGRVTLTWNFDYGRILSYSGPVSVYSMKESNPVIFEFFLGLQNAPKEPPKISEISKTPPLPPTYETRTKKELEILLRERGIHFKRTSKKQVLAQQLEEHDAQNRPANMEDEMELSSSEETPDIEMGEDIYSAA